MAQVPAESGKTSRMTGPLMGPSAGSTITAQDEGETVGKEKHGVYWTILADRHSRLIMDATCNVGKSAQQIISDSNVPQSTAYRKIRRLVESNLLEIYFEIGDGGRWENRYRHARGLSKDISWSDTGQAGACPVTGV
ncbi:MAG: hypothetical protein KGI33_01965 [Thaumarchaeota archaeon]|nr:hypothetical protein [Nitrososphaerota archaeon]